MAVDTRIPSEIVLNGVMNIDANLPEPDEMTLLPVSKLIVDRAYQRELNEVRVRWLVANFQPKSVGVLIVSRRPSGAYVVIDGQHRLMAVRATYGENSAIRIGCAVYTKLTVAAEAKMYDDLNRRRTAPRYMQTYRARLAWGDAGAQRLQALVSDVGLGLDLDGYGANKLNSVRAVSTLEKMLASADRLGQQEGYELVRDVLSILIEAFPDDERRVSDFMLSGLFAFLSRYRDAYSRTHLVRRLKDNGVEGISERAKGYMKLLNARRPMAVGQAILEAYNRHKTTHALPEWGAATDMVMAAVRMDSGKRAAQTRWPSKTT